ncbi:MAG: 30S ribosomal protein S6 [Candidatus Sumerlaeia bacterium]|nr:30S ribosomal protein S6 [Candidatus Sumerlaeia bacterium]
MPSYECAVILAPTLSDEQVNQHTEQVKGWLTALGAQVSDIDLWGRRRMAYPIAKHQDGIYIIFYFTFSGGQARLGELDKRMNTTETILRHMVIRHPALKELPRLPGKETVGEEGAEVEAAQPESAVVAAAPASEGAAAPLEGEPRVGAGESLESAPDAENSPV